MAEKDSQTKSMLKGAFWGGVVGGASSAAAINYIDDWALFAANKATSKKFDNAVIKVVLATTVVGAVIGAFAAAKSAKANNTPWTERIDDKSEATQLSR